MRWQAPERAGTAPGAAVGFFHHDRTLDDHSVSVRIDGPGRCTLRVGWRGTWVERALTLGSIEPGSGEQVLWLEIVPGRVRAAWSRPGRPGNAVAEMPWPNGFDPTGLDEVGVAYADGESEPARVDAPTAFTVTRLRLDRG